LPVSYNIFEEIKKKTPPGQRLRAVDMRHILLLLPFLLDGLLANVMLENNREHPLKLVFDPSSELIGSTMIFIQ
jgi:hypothetical protein